MIRATFFERLERLVLLYNLLKLKKMEELNGMIVFGVIMLVIIGLYFVTRDSCKTKPDGKEPWKNCDCYDNDGNVIQ
jgi:hypothetical protein